MNLLKLKEINHLCIFLCDSYLKKENSLAELHIILQKLKEPDFTENCLKIFLIENNIGKLEDYKKFWEAKIREENLNLNLNKIVNDIDELIKLKNKIKFENVTELESAV